MFRSHKHLYVQLVDDLAGKTLLGWSTKDGRFKPITRRGTVAAAQELGALVAQDMREKGMNRLVFDRGGYLYHGRVKALAEALRAGGLEV